MGAQSSCTSTVNSFAPEGTSTSNLTRKSAATATAASRRAETRSMAHDNGGGKKTDASKFIIYILKLEGPSCARTPPRRQASAVAIARRISAK
eukprot:scaffold61917_cov59-Phaeocystis_antarctica.AAC.5